jgi:hypothetical protein
VTADLNNFAVPGDTNSDGLCHVKPPDSSCYFAIQGKPRSGSGDMWQAHQGAGYTAYCYAPGEQVKNTGGAVSTTWFYIANGGGYGFGNSLWFDQSGTDGLPPCPGSVT